MTMLATGLVGDPTYRPGMDRRRFLLTTLAGAFDAPHAAKAQQAAKVYRLGYLSLTPLQVTHGLRSTAGLDSLRKGLTRSRLSRREKYRD
jgi:hypothetical protein